MKVVLGVGSCVHTAGLMMLVCPLPPPHPESGGSAPGLRAAISPPCPRAPCSCEERDDKPASGRQARLGATRGACEPLYTLTAGAARAQGALLWPGLAQDYLPVPAAPPGAGAGPDGESGHAPYDEIWAAAGAGGGKGKMAPRE